MSIDRPSNNLVPRALLESLEALKDVGKDVPAPPMGGTAERAGAAAGDLIDLTGRLADDQASRLRRFLSERPSAPEAAMSVEQEVDAARLRVEAAMARLGITPPSRAAADAASAQNGASGGVGVNDDDITDLVEDIADLAENIGGALAGGAEGAVNAILGLALDYAGGFGETDDTASPDLSGSERSDESTPSDPAPWWAQDAGTPESDESLRQKLGLEPDQPLPTKEQIIEETGKQFWGGPPPSPDEAAQMLRDQLNG